MNEETRFTAELKRVKSMADNTYDLTLNIPEYGLTAVYELMARMANEPLVEVVVKGVAVA
jgi:hypothetical protein